MALKDAIRLIEKLGLEAEEAEELIAALKEEVQDFSGSALSAEEAVRRMSLSLDEATRKQELGALGAQKHKRYLDELSDGLETVVNKEKAHAYALKAIRDALRKNVKALKANAEVNKDQIENFEKQIAASSLLVKRHLEAAAAADGLGSSFDGLTGRLGPLSFTSDSWNQSLFGMIGNLGSVEKASFSMAKAAEKAFAGVQNIIGSMSMKVMEGTTMMIGALDSAQASFYKSTGAGEEYGEIITTVRDETSRYGVTIDGSSEALKALYAGMQSFTDISETSRIELGSFVATMDRIGVSSDISVPLLNTFNKTLGMGATKSMAMTSQLIKASRAMDIPIAKLSSDLQAAMPTLAAYSRDAKKLTGIYMELSAMAKETGVETSRLLNITSQFDTFRGAAEATGRLNGILGGDYLNSLKMVEMSENDRIRAIHKSIKAQGKAFGSLGKYEQKAIAAAIGITDMDEANRLFGMSIDGLDARLNKLDKGEATLLSPDELQELADRSRNFKESIESIMQSISAFVGPIAAGLKTVLDWMTKIAGPVITGGILSLAAAMTVLTYVMKLKAAAAARAILMDAQLAAAQATVAAATEANTASNLESTVVEEGANARRSTSTLLYGANGQAIAANTIAKGTNATASGSVTVALGAELTATGANTVADGVEAAATGLNTAAKITNAQASIVSAAKYMLLLPIKAAYTAAIYAAAAGLAILTPITWAYSAAQTVLGLSSIKAALFVGLLAAALLLIGYALFASIHSPPLYIGLAILIGLMIGLAIAGGGATGPMMAFGVAMLFTGAALIMAGAGFLMAGIGAIGFGVALLMAAVALTIIAIAVVIVVAALVVLGASLVLIGLFALLAAPGLVMFAAAIVMLTGALVIFALSSWLTLPPLIALGVVVAVIALSMAHMFEAMAAGSAGLMNVTKNLKDVGQVMSAMPTSSVLKFALLTEGFENLAEMGPEASGVLTAAAETIKATVGVDETKVRALENMMIQINEMGTGTVVAAALGGLSSMIGNLTTTLTGASDVEEKGQDVLLVMDTAGTKVIAKAVETYLNKKHSAIVRRS